MGLFFRDNGMPVAILSRVTTARKQQHIGKQQKQPGHEGNILGL